MQCVIHLGAPRIVDALLGSFGSKVTMMTGIKFTDVFKRDSVAQVVDRSYRTAPSRDAPALSYSSTSSPSQTASLSETSLRARLNSNDPGASLC